MAVLDNDMAVYVAQIPSPHAMRTLTEVGRRVYPHSTGVGKALLMQLPNAAVPAVLKRTGMPALTENSHTTPEALIRDLELSRSRGYTVDEGEQEVGVRCFAVPVPGAPTLTAVSISGPAAPLTLKSATQVSPLLRRPGFGFGVRQGSRDLSPCAWHRACRGINALRPLRTDPGG